MPDPTGPRPLAEVAREVADDARRRHKSRRLLDKIVSEKAHRVFVEFVSDLGKRNDCADEIEAIVDRYLAMDFNKLGQSQHGRNIAARNVRDTKINDG